MRGVAMAVVSMTTRPAERVQELGARAQPGGQRPATHDALLTAQEVAALLEVPATWVYEQSWRGRIPTVTLGRYRRYRRQAILNWVASLES